ncbi:MFS transporter [Clostridium sp. 19966]|uniref:MFS transporter n=1 Tax=Clostridium sp. 19966 TaxID=2768166 RepID=UPI0028E07421|nr:MFS transporter [Clostridium sp. 19966]MDT8716178.1 MFS transporter [Clostridium sp. 19966]
MKNFTRAFKSMFNPFRGLSKEIWVIFLARVINAMGSFIFPLLTLILTTKLNVNESTAGYIMSISGIVYMGGGIIGGKLADTFGRKKILITLNMLGAVCYFIAALMPVSPSMIPMMVIAGFFIVMSGPVSGALVADLTTPQNRSGAYSLFYMGMNLGFAISPVVGGYLLQKHLNLLFFLDGFTSVIAMLLFVFFIPETIGMVKNTKKMDNKLESAVEGSVFKVLLERPILIFFALVMFGYNFVYSQWSYLYPMNISKIFSNGSAVYGKMVSFNAILVITMTPLITKLLHSQKIIRKIFYGGVFYVIGFGLPGYANSITAFYISCFTITMGEIIVTTSASPFIANHTPSSHRGRINSILPVITDMGNTLGPGIMGLVLGLVNIQGAWRVVGTVMIIFAVLTVMLERYDDRTKCKSE